MRFVPSKSIDSNTTVVFVTSDVAAYPGAVSIDECVYRFNRAVADAAHSYGFAVLEKSEIERRILHRSDQAARPIIKVEVYLPLPVPHLVSISLLMLLKCLLQAGVSVVKPLIL
jgi:hypothetical protein